MTNATINPNISTKIVLISGTPSVGKTNFLRYARSMGISDISLAWEQAGDRDLNYYKIKQQWNDYLCNDDKRFIQWVKTKLQCPTIVEWGYPAHCFPYVQKLHSDGIEAWWINGNETLARKKAPRSW